MVEYINRDKAIETVRKSHSIEEAHRRLLQITADDMAPVVRCKDCRYSEKINDHGRLCHVWDDGRLNDDFCSCGDRREDGKT